MAVYQENPDLYKFKVFVSKYMGWFDGSLIGGNLQVPDSMRDFFDVISDAYEYAYNSGRTIAKAKEIAEKNIIDSGMSDDFVQLSREIFDSYASGENTEADGVGDVSEIMFVPETAGNVFNLKKTLLVIAAVALLLLILKKK